MIAHIRLRAFDSYTLEQAWVRLSQVNSRFIGLPTQKVLYTVLRSPHVNKKALDQFYFQEKGATCTLVNVSSEDIKKCFDLYGVSCTVRFTFQTDFPSVNV